MDWHFTARVILFRSMDQACCIVYNEQTNRLRVYKRSLTIAYKVKQLKITVTTTKYISTSLTLAARVTLSIMRIGKVSL